ncbi:MAG: class I SAM-dependent methyltransferase [Nitrospiraceae bacterium]
MDRRFRGGRSFFSRVASLVMSRSKAKQRWIDYQFRFLPGRPGALLDFGCGNGSFLRQAESLGWDALGVDFDRAAVAFARQSGLNAVHVDEFDLTRIAGRFDAVTLSHVIEHVPHPKRTLAELHKALKQNGMIYVECPNAEAVGYRVFGQYWRGLEVPRHFSIPTRAALADALEGAGFRDVRFVPFPERFEHLFVESAAIEQRETGRTRALAACRTEWKDRIGSLEHGEFLTVTACSYGHCL